MLIYLFLKQWIFPVYDNVDQIRSLCHLRQVRKPHSLSFPSKRWVEDGVHDTAWIIHIPFVRLMKKTLCYVHTIHILVEVRLEYPQTDYATKVDGRCDFFAEHPEIQK